MSAAPLAVLPEDLTGLTATDIDTVLGALAADLYDSTAAIARTAESLHYLLGEHPTYLPRTRKAWPTTTDEAEYAVAARLAAGEFAPYNARNARTVLDRLAELRTRAASTAADLARGDAEWERRGRWSRFFLCKHVHSSTACRTLYPTSRVSWLPALSGLTEADAVAAHGALLCTVCFPSAPVEWTSGADKPAPDVCPGSKTFDYPTGTARRGYVTGNYGVCKHCTRQVTLTAAHRMRTHKPTA